MQFSKWMRQWGLVCVLLAVGLDPAVAERMTHLLVSGRAAYEDGLYSIAARRLEEVLRNGGDDEADAALWLARVRLAQGRALEAQDLLARHIAQVPASMALEYAFEQANVAAALGEWEAALVFLAPVVPPASDAQARPVTPSALWLLSRVYASQGAWDQAEAVCRRLDALCVSRPPQVAAEKKGRKEKVVKSKAPEGVDASAVAPAAWMDFADALLAAQEDERAGGLLKQVEDSWPGTPWAERAALKLLALQLDAAGAGNIPAEVAVDGQGTPEARIHRLHVAAQAQAQRRNWAAALASLDRALSIPSAPALRLETELLQARILLLSGETAAGIRQTREAIARLPDAKRAAELQLQLAEALADLSAWNEATAEYRVWLSAFSGQPATPRVRAGLAWALWEADRPAEAAPLFLQAAGEIAEPAEKAVLWLKAGDSYLAAGRFTEAMTAYAQIAMLDDRVPSILHIRAKLQLAEAQLASGETAAGEAALRELIAAEGAGAFAGQAMLRLGTLFDGRGESDAAKAEYTRIISAKLPDAMKAEALRARAMLAYQQGDIEQALVDFTRVTEEFPETAEQPFCAFMRGWCLLPLGRDTEALAAFRQFVEAHPDSPLRSAAIFRVGEYYFNRGDWAAAERYFSQMAQEYPTLESSVEALYWAGRAAAARREYLAANEYFNKLMERDQESPLLAQTLLAQGDVLSELGHFEAAILAFEEVIIKFGNSPEAIVAWGRKGDAQFTLGATNPARYEEALLSYRTLAGLPDASADARLQAIYKIARYLEKTGHTSAAFDHYMDVVYRFLQLEDVPPEATVWFTRSGFAAAAIRERAGDWREAAGIYKRVADSGVAAAPEARDRREAILRSQWLADTP